MQAYSVQATDGEKKATAAAAFEALEPAPPTSAGHDTLADTGPVVVPWDSAAEVAAAHSGEAVPGGRKRHRVDVDIYIKDEPSTRVQAVGKCC